MLSAGVLVGHLAPPVIPADVWQAWNLDPVLVVLLVTTAVVYARGARRGRASWAFGGALGALAVALVSPLDALSSSLASAHMVQHLLLTLVAAPLLAFSAPGVALLRGLPRRWRREVATIRRAFPIRVGPALAAHPLAFAVLHTVTLWAWHSRWLYELALRDDLVHRLEHVMFLATAWCSWVAIRAAAPGLAVLVLFGLSLQGSILGALLTFAREPWYPSYAGRTAAWDLTPLEDQQLAGLLMWVPAGAVYLVAALAMLAVHVLREPPRQSARRAAASSGTAMSSAVGRLSGLSNPRAPANSPSNPPR